MTDRIALNFAGCDIPYYVIVRILFVVKFASVSEYILSFLALSLFDRAWPADGKRQSVRLIGFGVANFQSTPDDSAPSLFADPADEAREKRERLSLALDALRDRGIEV